MPALAYTPPCRDAATETLGDVQKWITKIVHEYRARYNDRTEWEDLMQEANLAYLHALGTWDPDQGNFSNWLHIKVFDRLFGTMRTRLRRDRRYHRSSMPDLDGFASTTDDHPDLEGDARELYEAAMEAQRVATADALWNHARHRMGWDAGRFLTAFETVRECLR